MKYLTSSNKFEMEAPQNRFCYLILIAFWLLPFFCSAQGYAEGFSFYYNYIALKAEKQASGARFSGQQFKANANIPLYLKKDRSTYLLVGGALESIYFNGTPQYFHIGEVYGIQPTLGYGQVLSQRLTLLVLFQPSWSTSDLLNIRGSDFIMGGGARLTYTVNSNLSLRFTMGYRQQFFGPQYLPLVGLDWKINERWRIFGDLPNVGTLVYKINDKTNAGVYYLGNNYSFHVPTYREYLKYTVTSPGLFIERYLGEKWAIRLTGTYTVARNLDLYKDQDKPTATILFFSLGDKPTPLNPKIGGGAEFKVTISYRVK